MNRESKAIHIRILTQAAFKVLRTKGYRCRSNFSCCGGCATYEMCDYLRNKGVKEDDMKFVYWHQQDDQALHENYCQEEDGPSLYLGWSGNGNEICQALLNVGLLVEWDGKDDKRFRVYLTDDAYEDLVA